MGVRWVGLSSRSRKAVLFLDGDLLKMFYWWRDWAALMISRVISLHGAAAEQ